MGHEKRGPGVSLRDSYFLKRKEEKYEMQVGAATFLREEIKRHLPLFEFRKGHPHTYITTIYFDTEKLDFYTTAKSFYDDNIKLRVKEYYYRNNRESGLAHQDDGAWVTFDSCFVEIKQRIRGLVVKRRFETPKHLFGRLLRGDDVWDELVQSRNGIEFNGMLDTYREFRWFVQHYQVIPKSIINYRRSVYQQDELELRITFDDEIAVFAPCPGLYDKTRSMARNHLGTPRQVFDKVIMEIKCQNGYPDWLLKVLRTHRTKRLSKFTTSLRVLTHELPCPESNAVSKSGFLGINTGPIEPSCADGNGDTTQVGNIKR